MFTLINYDNCGIPISTSNNIIIHKIIEKICNNNEKYYLIEFNIRQNYICPNVYHYGKYKLYAWEEIFKLVPNNINGKLDNKNNNILSFQSETSHFINEQIINKIPNIHVISTQLLKTYGYIQSNYGDIMGFNKKMIFILSKYKYLI